LEITIEKKKEWKDVMQRFRGASIFWESRHPDYPAYFTTKDEDLVKKGITYTSLKQIYLSYDHIPGYELDFANEVLGGWKHWLLLTEVSQVRTLINEWREELDIRIKADSLRMMMVASKDNDAKGVGAAKYLADKGYEKKRGRPSKEEVTRETKIQSAANKELESDMDRIGLKLVNQPGVH
jgi:hypothetical protein